MKPFTYEPRNFSPGDVRVLGSFHRKPLSKLPALACDSHVHIFGPRDRYPLADDRTFAPGVASVEALCALHDHLGIMRTVIVQASPQGTDNRCVLDAVADLRALGRPARAVVVLPADTPREKLQAFHDAGVRGLRVNLQSYGRTDSTTARRSLQLAASMARSFGWHIQIYTTLAVIAEMREVIRTLPVPLVVDHFGLAEAGAGVHQPGFSDLLSLVRDGHVYVKLSASYRVIDQLDGRDGFPIVRALIDANVERMLWGSDWPHTGPRPGRPRELHGVDPFHAIDDGAQLDIFASWTTEDERNRILVHNPSVLYDF